MIRFKVRKQRDRIRGGAMMLVLMAVLVSALIIYGMMKNSQSLFKSTVMKSEYSKEMVITMSEADRHLAALKKNVTCWIYQATCASGKPFKDISEVMDIKLDRIGSQDKLPSDTEFFVRCVRQGKTGKCVDKFSDKNHSITPIIFEVVTNRTDNAEKMHVSVVRRISFEPRTLNRYSQAVLAHPMTKPVTLGPAVYEGMFGFWYKSVPGSDLKKQSLFLQPLPSTPLIFKELVMTGVSPEDWIVTTADQKGVADTQRGVAFNAQPLNPESISTDLSSVRAGADIRLNDFQYTNNGAIPLKHELTAYGSNGMEGYKVLTTYNEITNGWKNKNPDTSVCPDVWSPSMNASLGLPYDANACHTTVDFIPAPVGKPKWTLYTPAPITFNHSSSAVKGLPTIMTDGDITLKGGFKKHSSSDAIALVTTGGDIIVSADAASTPYPSKKLKDVGASYASGPNPVFNVEASLIAPQGSFVVDHRILTESCNGWFFISSSRTGIGQLKVLGTVVIGEMSPYRQVLTGGSIEGFTSRLMVYDNQLASDSPIVLQKTSTQEIEASILSQEIEKTGIADVRKLMKMDEKGDSDPSQ